MAESVTDSIHKQITLRAQPERVWKALTDHVEFGRWFQVELDGPFVAGEVVEGRITHEGCSHMRFEARVEALEPLRRFAYRWWPTVMEPGAPASGEASTLVEFFLEPADGGTQLTVIESGFDALPADRREDALRRNDGGWTEQMENIRAHVDG